MYRLLFVLFFGSALTAHAQANTSEQKNNVNINHNSNGTFNSGNVPANSKTQPGNSAAGAGTISNEPLKALEDTFQLEVPQTIDLDKSDDFAPRERFLQKKEKAAISPSIETISAPGKLEETIRTEESESVDTPSASQQFRMQQQFESNQYNSTRQYNRRSASSYEQMNMDNSVQYYRKAAPNSFETHFYAYLAGHYDTDLYPELEAAAKLNPQNTDVRKQLAAYHIINNDPGQAVPIIRELIDTGAVSSGELLYANDLLLSGDTESIIVTHGFEDMFATYFVQNNNAVRPDVKLLSLDFMQSDAYRSQWANEALKLPETDVIDTAYLAELCRLNADKKLQLSMTIPKDYFTGMRRNLYPVGLTFRYSEQPVDNFVQNYELWSGRMNLELVKNASGDSGDNWCTNYLPMLVTLRKQLLILGRKEEVKTIDEQIRQIGLRTNNSDRLKKYTK